MTLDVFIEIRPTDQNLPSNLVCWKRISRMAYPFSERADGDVCISSEPRQAHPLMMSDVRNVSHSGCAAMTFPKWHSCSATYELRFIRSYRRSVICTISGALFFGLASDRSVISKFASSSS